MQGVYVQIEETSIIFVATDAHRLVRYRRVDVVVSNPTSFIVPQKALNLLRGSLDASQNKDVVIYYNENNAFFQTEDLLLACRLIDQKYPDYENVIPVDGMMIPLSDHYGMQSVIRVP